MPEKDQDQIEESSRESFPASDPPAWEPLHTGAPKPPGRRTVLPLLKTAALSFLFLYLWGVLVARWLIGSDRWDHPASTGITRITAVVIMAAGLSLGLWCALEFAVRGLGTPAPFDPPKRLVVRGLYRYTRNPMYVGALAALLGEALFFRAWQIAALAAVLFAAVNVFLIFFEEPQLVRRFGADYKDYCRRVGRWL